MLLLLLYYYYSTTTTLLYLLVQLLTPEHSPSRYSTLLYSTSLLLYYSTTLLYCILYCTVLPDAEVHRLEQDYNTNWHAYESENLAAAFRSQLERVESEWTQHEQSLTEDYNRKKITEKIGHNRIKEKTSSSSSSSNARENAEKKRFSQDLDSLHSQKAASQRWMNRQEVRLQAQASEVACERGQIGTLLGEERKKFHDRKRL